MPAERLVPARPRRPEEIARLPARPDVLTTVAESGVQDVVHFTTMTGAVGVLAARAVKSRARLPEDKYLEYVYQPNAKIRKDREWLDYVNLSVERINDWMFDASRRWQAAEDNPWVVLSFSPQILAHPGVVFTTTNNIYPACTRAEGRAGFEQMFSDRVVGRYGVRHDRSGKLPAWPTDRQAEVLYPGELSCEHLQRIDVQTEGAVDAIHGMLSGLRITGVTVCHAPEVFK